MTHHDYRTIELDPLLLNTPFETSTKWHVLTGAACSGKTTMLKMLVDRGYHVIPESARLYFEQELAKGRNINEIRQDGAALQREIANLQLRLERNALAGSITFLDRALPDSLTFYRLYGLNPNEILPECFHYLYASVFILDQLPFHREKTLGPEDEEASAFVDHWLLRDYSALGYQVVRVPVMSPQERLDYIFSMSPF